MQFGEVDIDGSLVASHSSVSEDIVMVNNGCLCCTVRGDLVKMLLKLAKEKRDKFDHIVIETTGLAKPAPVIETFCTDELVSRYVKLDGVVTLVDSKHAMQHLNEVKPRFVVNEAVEQIAYADRIILNKIDLVTEAELEVLAKKIKGGCKEDDALEAKMQGGTPRDVSRTPKYHMIVHRGKESEHINGMAQMKHAKFGYVDMDFVLGVGGYDLERIDSEVHVDSSCSVTHQHETEHGHHKGHPHDHTHDSAVSSVSIVYEGNLDLDEVQKDTLARSPFLDYSKHGYTNPALPFFI
uniref:CobW/HypB/UreG nucleotide-binding domain-containing protein n=1 Tax=Fagus sylvatica TaxID=28930 RepID=A0A2N9FAY1_FAGSY